MVCTEKVFLFAKIFDKGMIIYITQFAKSNPLATFNRANPGPQETSLSVLG